MNNDHQYHSHDRFIVEDALYDAGLTEQLDDGECLREHYSGRNMYGENCFGVVVDHIGQAMAFVAALNDYENGGALQLAKDARHDDMGLQMIVYFPGHVIIDDE